MIQSHLKITGIFKGSRSANKTYRQSQLIVFDLAIDCLKYYLVLMVALLAAAVVDVVAAGVIVVADPAVDEPQL